MNYKISLIDKLPKAIEKKMEDGLLEYELSHGVNVDFKPFALVLYDGNNEVIGVLDAFSSYSSIYINNLWVDKAHRGNGCGRQLIAELENHFKGKGFHYINTVSCAFQAPEFYKKCGFDVEFVRKNSKNPKLTTAFLVKYFDDIL